MSPTIILDPAQIQAARILVSAGFSVSLGLGGSTLSSDQFAFLTQLQQGLGATIKTPLAAVPLWDTEALDFSLTNEGDANPWPVSTSYVEVGRGDVLAHSWRDRGFILLCIGGHFLDSASGSIDLYVSLESRLNARPLKSDSLPRGRKDGAFTVHKEWRAQTMACDPVERQFMLTMFIHAAGHTAATWKHIFEGRLTWEQPPAAIDLASRQEFCGKLATAYDPRRRRTLRAQVKAAAVSGTQTIKITKSSATFFHPRDGTGYDS